MDKHTKYVKKKKRRKRLNRVMTHKLWNGRFDRDHFWLMRMYDRLTPAQKISIRVLLRLKIRLIQAKRVSKEG